MINKIVENPDLSRIQNNQEIICNFFFRILHEILLSILKNKKGTFQIEIRIFRRRELWRARDGVSIPSGIRDTGTTWGHSRHEDALWISGGGHERYEGNAAGINAEWLSGRWKERYRENISLRYLSSINIFNVSLFLSPLRNPRPFTVSSSSSCSVVWTSCHGQARYARHDAIRRRGVPARKGVFLH